MKRRIKKIGRNTNIVRFKVDRRPIWPLASNDSRNTNIVRFKDLGKRRATRKVAPQSQY